MREEKSGSYSEKSTVRNAVAVLLFFMAGRGLKDKLFLPLLSALYIANNLSVRARQRWLSGRLLAIKFLVRIRLRSLTFRCHSIAELSNVFFGHFEEVDVIFGVPKKRTVIDVGGHVGFHTVFWASVSDRVVCVEPIPLHCAIIRENLEENSLAQKVRLHQAAAWSSPGQLEITDLGASSSVIGPQSQQSARKLSVQGVTLDSLLQSDGIDNSSVDLLKIDVEGAEEQVLAGSKRLLEKSRPKIIFEALDDGAYGRIVSFLEPFGYSTVQSLSEHTYVCF